MTNELPDEKIATKHRPRCIFCNNRGQPLYSGLEDHLFGVSGLWNIDQCVCCELLWLNPCPTEESISKLYRTYYTHENSANKFLLTPTFKNFPKNKKIKYAILAAYFNYDIMMPAMYRFVGVLIGLIPTLRRKISSGIGGFYQNKSGKLLDIGCGNGDYLLEMKYLGWDVFGIEIDEKAALVAKQLGLNVTAGALEIDSYPENYFSAIHMNNVIEHLSTPKEIMSICYKILKPGGRLTIKTCSNKSLAHTLYKQDYRGLEIPRHFFVYSPKSLKILGEKCGFTAEVVQTSLNEYIWISSYKIKNRLKDPAFINGNKFIIYTLRFFSLFILLIRPLRGDDVLVMFKKS